MNLRELTATGFIKKPYQLGFIMDIALCFDKNFAMQAAVTIASISINNHDDNVAFHLLSDNLDDKLRQRIRFSLKSPHHKVIFYEIDRDLLEDCPVNNDLICPSLAKYYRLLLPQLLPQEIKRVLYLDCDIIVTQRLRHLFDMDMQGKAVGVVTDQKPYIIDNYNRLQLDLEDGYFNSGVILFNLTKWRKENYVPRIFSFIKENQEKLVWEDQDAMNKIFAKDKIWLPIKYNLQQAMMYVQTWMLWRDYENLNKALLHPVCIHFCGAKPWYKDCEHPYAEIWLYYLSVTYWSSYQLIDIGTYKRLKTRISKKIKFWIGVDRWNRQYNPLCLDFLHQFVRHK